MPTALPRRIPPDVVIPGDHIAEQEATAEYGWMPPADYWRGPDIIWENAHFPSGMLGPGAGWTQVRRIRHTITERIEIVEGDRKGERLDH